jgi:hypothetical protein
MRAEDTDKEFVLAGGKSFMKTLTEKEAAQVLSCSIACLRRMRHESRGPRWTRVGRLVRYSDQWLSEYLEANSSRPVKTLRGQ